MQTIYSIDDIRKAGGLTYRQADHLARTGVLNPSLAEARGKGSRRVYSETDLRAARIIGEAKRLGINPGLIRLVVKYLRGRRRKKEVQGLLVTDGESLRVLKEEDVAAYLRSVPGSLWVVPLQKTRVSDRPRAGR